MQSFSHTVVGPLFPHNDKEGSFVFIILPSQNSYGKIILFLFNSNSRYEKRVRLGREPDIYLSMSCQNNKSSYLSQLLQHSFHFPQRSTKNPLKNSCYGITEHTGLIFKKAFQGEYFVFFLSIIYYK